MRILIRHFFERFFDRDSLSPRGEPETNFTQALGILAAPGAFIALIFQPLTFTGWDLVTIRCFFISFSMIVMSFLVVLHWDALFPDRRDYQVLTPLPIGQWSMFSAKAAAFAVFLGIFLLDVNLLPALLWPGIENSRSLLAPVAAQLLVVVLSGLFAVLALATLQGLLATLLPATAFRRAAVWMQTLLMGILVMLLFVSPKLAGLFPLLARRHSPWVYAFPAYWFAGLYEHLRPAIHSTRDSPSIRFLLDLGNLAAWSLAAAAALFLLLWLPGYRRHARKLLDVPLPNPSGRAPWQAALAARLDRSVLRRPVQMAVFHFINRTLARSMKHRLFLASYAGCGAALALWNFGSGRSGLLRLPLTLSFILISALRAAFNFPCELPSNWMFRITDSNALRDCAAAVRKWIVLCALTPLLLLQAPLEFAEFAWPAALFHLAFDAALSLLLMEVLFAGLHKVPFTCSYFPGKINLVFLGVIYIFGFTLYSNTMASLEAALQAYPSAAAAFFALAAAAYLLLANRRAPAARLSYDDEGEPAVRTLELSA